MAPWYSGYYATLSRWKREFNSHWSRCRVLHSTGNKVYNYASRNVID